MSWAVFFSKCGCFGGADLKKLFGILKVVFSGVFENIRERFNFAWEGFGFLRKIWDPTKKTACGFNW